ncbi:hypothetical protein RB195_003243 [Necator americanus]|uniref:G-protein coupled receptors family 1 profile domain-containing protein n=1 Tax=Necator americanus TaxID=51031 RepID=A0ABR1DMR4_NECAM
MHQRNIPALLINSYIFCGEGVLILVMDVPFVLVILLFQRFRKRKEFLFIAGVTIGDLIYTVGYMSVSIRRILTSGSYDGEMTLFTAIDRLIATIHPVWHFKQGFWYPAIMCLSKLINVKKVYLGRSMNMENDLKEELNRRMRAAWTAFAAVREATDQLADQDLRAHLFDSTLLPALCYAAETSGDLVSAMCFDSFYPPFRIPLFIHRWGCIILSALIYIIVSLLLYKKFARNVVKFRGTQPNVQQKKNLINATITMGLSTLNALLFMFIPDVLLFIRISKAHLAFLILYSLMLNRIMFNFVLFVIRHREFRRIFTSIFCSKRRTVNVATVLSNVLQFLVLVHPSWIGSDEGGYFGLYNYCITMECTWNMFETRTLTTSFELSALLVLIATILSSFAVFSIFSYRCWLVASSFLMDGTILEYERSVQSRTLSASMAVYTRVDIGSRSDDTVNAWICTDSKKATQDAGTPSHFSTCQNSYAACAKTSEAFVAGVLLLKA